MWRREEGLADEPASSNQSVRRAVAILREVGRHPKGLTLAELARAVSLPRPTVVRFVETLEQERLLARAAGSRRVVLGAGLTRIAAGYVGGRELLAAARIYVEQLAGKFNEAVEVALVVDVFKEDVYQAVDVLLRLESSKVLQAASNGPEPLHATSIGKLLLTQWPSRELDAFLARPHPRLTRRTMTDARRLRAEVRRVRRSGLAEAVDEVEEGVCGVASGIFDAQEKLIGVLHMEGPTARLGPELRSEALELMARAASAIRADLAGGLIT